jgi:chromosome segregation ATPase
MSTSEHLIRALEYIKQTINGKKDEIYKLKNKQNDYDKLSLQLEDLIKQANSDISLLEDQSKKLQNDIEIAKNNEKLINNL